MKRFIPLGLFAIFISGCSSSATSNAANTAPNLEPPTINETSPGLASVSVRNNGTQGKSISLDLPSLVKTDSQNDDDTAEKMGTVRVVGSKLVGYNFICHEIHPGYGPAFLIPREPGHMTLYMEPGYWGYEIVKIEGMDVATTIMEDWTRLLRHLPEPMHLVIKSRSGLLKEVEAVTHID